MPYLQPRRARSERGAAPGRRCRLCGLFAWSHRGPAGKRNTTTDEQTAEGYLFFTDPPQPSSSRAGSRAGRGSGPSSSRGGCGGGRGCGGQGGRGKKSAVSKAADKARLATLMAVRKEVEAAGGSWDPVRGCAVDSCRAVPDDVECMIAWASRRVRRLKLRERPQQRMRLSTLMPRRMHDWQAVGVGAGGWRAGCERRAQRAAGAKFDEQVVSR